MEEVPKREAWWRPALEIFGRVSVWVVVPIVGALIAGKMLDTRYETRPWIFLSLSGLGFLVSSLGIVSTVGNYIRRTAEEEKGNSQENPNQKNDKGVKPTNQ